MSRSHLIVAVLGGFLLSSLAGLADAAPVGLCKFDPQALRFVGAPGDQAACLLRKVKPKGGASAPQAVPAWLLDRLEKPIDLNVADLDRVLATEGATAADLGGPLKIGDAPVRRYFVIHDTSSPEISAASAFPANIDTPAYSGNNLAAWGSLSKKVNLIVSRDGRSRTFNDWKTDRTSPATKLEQNSVLPAARKVFVHVENVQPRIKPAGSWGWIAPDPGFSKPQTRRLALAYVIASARAGRWLVPALHYNIDKDGPAGEPHDDPQNFDLPGWVEAVRTIDETARSGTAPSPSPAAAHNGTWPAWVDLGGLTDLNEDYRAQFALCDSANRFRDIALPATIGGRKYYGCSSDKNKVTALKSLPTPGGAAAAVIFTSKLSVDLDGSWFACNTPGHTDQCGTSLMLKNAAGVSVPVGADAVPYVVIPLAGPTSALAQEFRTLTGVRAGDFGVVVTATQVIPVIVADGGPFSKLGEGSIALHRRVGRELCATKDAQGRCKTMISPLGSAAGPFVTVLFPGSRIAGLKSEQAVATTEAEGLRLWNQVKGQLGR